jgi:AraC family transcriptional regulator
MQRSLTAHAYSERLQRVAAHIHAHLDEPLDLDRLAAVACFSPFHFHRIYRTCMGETVAETVARLRLQRAAMQLARSPRPVGEIARAAGYASQAAFSRAFRASYGAGPAAFRRERGVPSRGDPRMTIVIQDRAPMRIAAVPHKGPPQQIGAAFDKVMAWAGPRGITVPPSAGVALYLSDMSVTPAADQRALAGLTVGPDVAADDTVSIREVPGGRHAVLLFKGPYARLPQAYDEFFTWLPTSGEEPGDAPFFEISLNDPRTTSPEELLTEICLPLKG